MNAMIGELLAARQLIETMPEDKAVFRDRFGETSNALSKAPLLSHSWAEFVESLVPQRLWNYSEVANTLQPGEHFQLDDLLAPRIDRRFYSSLPNILVGTGLLVTFLGLAAGIHLASKGLVSASTAAQDLSDTFGALLGGAFLSFSKSAAGISCSIAFGLYDNFLLARADKALSGFTQGLEKRMTLVTQERLLVEVLNHAHDQLREATEQTGQLKRFNTDLAVSVGQALDKVLETKVSQRFAPALQQVIDALSAIRSDRGAANENMMRGVVSEFKQSSLVPQEQKWPRWRKPLVVCATRLEGPSRQWPRRSATPHQRRRE